jgi:hypothetical protein
MNVVVGGITQYVKDKNGNKVGVLAALKLNGRIIIAGAKAHRSAGDRFDKQTGFNIAMDRIVKTVDCGRRNRIAASLESGLDAFSNRCVKYFKTRPENIIRPEVIPYR